MKIEFNNMPKNTGKINFILRLVFNILRTWYLLNIVYPWVEYHGFVRIMKNTNFAKRKIKIGNNVQFGRYCEISTDTIFGNNILLASRVSIIGRNDHDYSVPGQTIWYGDRKDENVTTIENDVWIGYNAIILAGVTIGKGSIIAAGALVNCDIPACEIWGGIPAKKIKNRFNSELETKKHIEFLTNLK
jgi:chloramphenicol O-acetyltransferase type B